MLLQNLVVPGDAILTFNYDFVAETMLANYNRGNRRFGDWVYAFSHRPCDCPQDVPTLFKLHGSLNWELSEDENGEVQNARIRWPETWKELGEELKYLNNGTENKDRVNPTRAPILLPYWDKRVERGIWLKIWKGAAAQLRRTDSLIIWGYSLPTTDLKARELMKLAFRPGSRLRKVAVIDPSTETQDRWRAMFLDKEFWRFRSFREFHEFLIRKGTNLAPFRFVKGESGGAE